MKNKKHDKIIYNFDEELRKHLGKVATKLVKQSELNDKLREKDINLNILFNATSSISGSEL